MSLWTKSHGVTIQMKPLQQHFHMVLFNYYEVLNFESMDKIPWCDHSNETSSTTLSHGTIFLNFESMDKIQWCDHSNETSSTALLHGTI